MATEKLEIQVELKEDKKSTDKVFDSIEKSAGKSGKKIGNELNSSTGGIFSGAIASAGKLATALGVVGLVTAGVAASVGIVTRAASQQEDSINSLNSALRLNNELSAATSKDLQDFASALQGTTRFGDEAVISQLAFAQSMGATAEQSKLVLTASADLASALNIDLNSATRNVAKTLGGFAGELGEVIPELKALTQEQLRAGKGVELLANRFQGAATDSANTFSGSLDQLSNNFGDLLESLGFLITNSPIAQTAIDGISESIKFLNDTVKALGGEPIQIVDEGQLNRQITEAQTGIASLDKQIQDFQSRDRSAFFGLTTTFSGTIENLKKQKDELIILELELQTQLNDVRKRAREQEAAQSTAEQAKLAEERQAALTNLQNFGILTEEILIQRLQREAEALQTARDLQLISDDEFANANLARLQAYEDAKLKIAQQGNKKRNKEQLNANKILANSVAQGTSALFDSILQGENVFKALGNFVLNVLGDLATQTGQFFIAQGIAIEALKSLGGAASIAAGVALVALGSLFKSLGSGGGSAATSVPTGSGAATPTVSTDTEVTDQVSQQPAQPGNIVNLTIEGNILDRRESGLAIVDIINEAIDSDNVTINQSFA